MPLTFAHPAAVLPLMRGPLVPSALVAGALAPDLPYFLRALRIPVSAQSWWEPFLNATTTHAWPGVLTTALPLALLVQLALVYCRQPARWALAVDDGANAAPVNDRHGTTQQGTGRRGPGAMGLVWVAVSLALGVLTHVVWDSLTDSDRWLAQGLAALGGDGLGPPSWGRLLQHASTAVGLVVLVVVAWRRRGAWPSSNVARSRFLRVVAVLLATTVAGTVAVVAARYEAVSGLEHLLTSAAIGAGVGAALGAAALSLLWWAVRPDQSRGARS